MPMAACLVCSRTVPQATSPRVLSSSRCGEPAASHADRVDLPPDAEHIRIRPCHRRMSYLVPGGVATDDCGGAHHGHATGLRRRPDHGRSTVNRLNVVAQRPAGSYETGQQTGDRRAAG